MKRVSLIGLCALAGCAVGGPEEGDVYEDLLTGQRVEISGAGECGERFRLHDRLFRDMVERTDSTDWEARLSMINLIGMPSLYPGTDSTAQCIEYDTVERVGRDRMRILNIVPVDQLQEKRWKRLS